MAGRVITGTDGPFRYLAESSRVFDPPEAGTRTQQTNSALPMSKAATRSMICSSSVDSANIDAHLPPPRDMELDGVAVRGDHQAGNRI